MLEYYSHTLAIAHCEAATNPKTNLLHRDISGGNILILPTVVDRADGSRSLKWTGLLADWEMSKPRQNAPSKPRQPERTVSYMKLLCATKLTVCPGYLAVSVYRASFPTKGRRDL